AHLREPGHRGLSGDLLGEQTSDGVTGGDSGSGEQLGGDQFRLFANATRHRCLVFMWFRGGRLVSGMRGLGSCTSPIYLACILYTRCGGPANRSFKPALKYGSVHGFISARRLDRAVNGGEARGSGEKSALRLERARSEAKRGVLRRIRPGERRAICAPA